MNQDSNPSPAPNPGQLVEINDVDTLTRAIYHWHVNKVRVCEHMKSIPEGTEVTMEDDNQQQKKVVLTSDVLQGFQLGLSFALSELGELPFTFKLEDEVSGERVETELPPAAGVSLN